MHAMPGHRTIVIGSSNSGKSTTAERLAALKGVPFIELDALHWKSGWVKAELAEFRETVSAAIEPDEWVIAGNYFEQQRTVSWPRADTVVILDMRLQTILRRYFRRTWKRWRTQEELYGGDNRESIMEQFMIWDVDKSLFAHIVRSYRRRRREFDRLPGDPRWSHITFIRLRSVEEVEQWLADISKASTGASGRAERVSSVYAL
jgi:adenylate kinase family enzyme